MLHPESSPATAPLMRVYFVRHGQSKFNGQFIHQHAEVELSPLGERQAKFVAKRFTNLPVDVILCSHYKRAKMTAEAINKVTKKKIQYTSLLSEFKRPTEIEGKKFDDPEAVKIKNLIAKHWNDPKWHYSDEDNFYDFKDRLYEFVNYLQKRKEKNIVVVSHEFAIKMTLALMMFGYDNLNQDSYNHIGSFFNLKNTGITIIECTHDGKWQLVTWNDHVHLGDV